MESIRPVARAYVRSLSGIATILPSEKYAKLLERVLTVQAPGPSGRIDSRTIPVHKRRAARGGRV
jgi:hypothetical protein